MVMAKAVQCGCALQYVIHQKKSIVSQCVWNCYILEMVTRTSNTISSAVAAHSSGAETAFDPECAAPPSIAAPPSMRVAAVLPTGNHHNVTQTMPITCVEMRRSGAVTPSLTLDEPSTARSTLQPTPHTMFPGPSFRRMTEGTASKIEALSRIEVF